MTNLKTLNQGYNKYCGPAVLSILTGRSTDDCANAISRVNGQYNVKGVYTTDLLKAAERLGFEHEPAPSGNSLYGTFIKLCAKDGMYVVSLDTHFVTVEVIKGQIYLCDNHTKEPIVGQSSARLGQKVTRVDRVWKVAEPPAPPPEPPKPQFTTLTMFECNDCGARDKYIHGFVHYKDCKWA